MKLAENKKGLFFIDRFGNEEAIHINHASETLNEIKEDVFSPYLVAEEATNFARTHLVMATSEDESLQLVDEYLREVEEVEESHLIGTFLLTY